MSAMNRSSIVGGRAAPPRKEQPVFSFPLLELKDICSVLQEMGVVVTENDLSNPKSEQFRQICELFIMDILGLTKDEMDAPNPNHQDKLGEFMELHDESVPVIHFLHNINKVLHAAQCDEGFSLRDLMKPERTRVRRILSALINLQKFKVGKLEWYNKLESEKNELLQRKAVILEKQQKVMQLIAQEKAKREAEQPEVDAVAAQRKALSEKLESLKAEDDLARIEAEKLRSEIIAMRTEKDEILNQLEETRARVKSVKGQVVSSPERIRREANELEIAVEREQRQINDAEAERQLLITKLQVVAKAEKDLIKATTLIGEAELDSRKLKKIQMEEKQKKSELAQLEADQENKRVVLEDAVERLSREQANTDDHRESAHNRQLAQEKQIESTKAEIAQLAESIKHNLDDKRTADAERVRLEQDQEKMIAEHSAEVAEIVSKMKQLSANVQSYNNSVLSNLNVIEAIPFRKAE